MKKAKYIATLAMAAALSAVASTTTSAYAAVAPACGSNVCTWEGAEYRGQKATSGGGRGVCYKDTYVLSAVVAFNATIRFYSGPRCQGYYVDKKKGAIANMEAFTSDIGGWTARSYKRV
ncbi:hypothetical protein ACFPH6_36120 [Streptomyces xiangluensis]|uniref:Peptidase inhibitor family I36 n=1 Tax=Streptomyces xiangluensis TaxID=2665720 RepID=A0ABV8YXI8_9ACTN